MKFELKDILTAIGPSASIVFAARAASRHGNLRDQVRLYRRRVALMRQATNIGLSVAMLLIGTLILAAINVVLPDPGVLTYFGAGLPVLALAS